jgi:catechol 2,3-dioxygenase-like lactoylglutathione lyase family enzyme
VKAAGIHHVGLVVTDVDAARHFYLDRLGLSERDDRPDFGFGGAWLQVGDQQVHLIEGREPAPGGGHFALAVDDLDSVVAQLRGAGVTVSDPVPVGTGRQSFVRDPSGNVVELNQPS